MATTAIKNLAIDLGNNNTILSDPQSILASQPSCIALNSRTRKVEAYGDQAYNMLEKTHAELKVIRPLQGGVISDADSAGKLLQHMVKEIRGSGFFTPRLNYLISGVPYDTTNVERRALSDALSQFSPGKQHLIFEPIAAAIGMGIDIRSPQGQMIIDMGGGITEVVVISLSGVVTFKSIKVAGDTMDMDIQDHFRNEYHLDIGLKTAEAVKIRLGCVQHKLSNPDKSVMVKGKDRAEGIPSQREIRQTELCDVLDKSVRRIEECIQQTLDTCPPELSSDIYQNGIQLTGGTSQLAGMDRRLAELFSLPVVVDKNAMTSVSRGLSEIVGTPNKHRAVMI
jgi:rod shape-determining protein MreB